MFSFQHGAASFNSLMLDDRKEILSLIDLITNIYAIFLKLIQKYFLNENKLSKLVK